jgi:hypothetical protein
MRRLIAEGKDPSAERQVGELLLDIDGYTGRCVTRRGSRRL